MTLSWKDWNDGWIKEGHYICYELNGIEYYEQVKKRDLGHWEYVWESTVASHTPSGPTVPDDLEITRGYDSIKKFNHLWQLIFGIRGQVYVYIELPTDTHRHGIPKVPKPSSTLREVSHFEEWMSPFYEPSFITEHFLMRPGFERIGLDIYNPRAITLTPEFNFIINKMTTERIGQIIDGKPSVTRERFNDVMDKLYKKLIPVRPISLQPESWPATAPSGE